MIIKHIAIVAACLVMGVLLTVGGVGRADRRPLVVAAVSCESRVRQTDFNLDRIEHWARKAAAAGADLVLFPECGIQGWWASRENRKYAEPIGGPSVKRLIKLAGELNIIIVAGMTELDGDKAYITQVMVNGRGVIGKHRKSSLAGGDNGEAKIWDPGNDTNVFHVKGRTIGIAICFESVHPETCAALAAKGAEIILAPYANGTDPNEITDPERKQRAWVWDRVKENHVWYVACDDAPRNDDGKHRDGAAYVINPAGKLVAITPGEGPADGPGEAMVVYSIPAPKR
jgi:predicted amidohydrolase